MILFFVFFLVKMFCEECCQIVSCFCKDKIKGSIKLGLAKGCVFMHKDGKRCKKQTEKDSENEEMFLCKTHSNLNKDEMDELDKLFNKEKQKKSKRVILV
jgi:hypothetical protein